jgi:hypothetical protein
MDTTITDANALFWAVTIKTLGVIVAELTERLEYYQGAHPEALFEALDEATRIYNIRR